MSVNRWMNEDSVEHIHMVSSVINKNEMTFTGKKLNGTRDQTD